MKKQWERLWLVCGCGAMFALLFRHSAGYLVLLGGSLAAILAGCLRRKRLQPAPGRRSQRRGAYAAAAVLLAVLLARFCAEDCFGLNRLALPVGALLAAVAWRLCFRGLLRLFCTADALYARPAPGAEPVRERRRAMLLSLLSAAMILGVCSKSSPLYPFNDWGDANCFFTVGKAMFRGQVLYRDIYEQKGPLLYFLHGLAGLISQRTFFGVYLLETVAAAAFLYFAFRCARLTDPAMPFWPVALAGALIYSAPAFCHGDSAEELCLPLLMASLWLGVRALRENRPLRFAECFAVGAMAAWVLWIKYTMLGFFIGWFLAPAACMLRRRQWKALGVSILGIGAGVLAMSAPVLVYFACSGALGDCFTVYFYNNMFLYSEEVAAGSGLWGRLARVQGSVSATLRYNRQYGALIWAGALPLLWGAPVREKLHWILTAFFTAFFVYMGGRGYVYYGFILAVFAMVGLPFLYRTIRQLFPREKRRMHPAASVAAAALCAALALGLTPNAYLLGTPRSRMPQYRFREIIEREGGESLLNYGFLDGGYYTVCGIAPSCRFFCGLNIPLPELQEEQRSCLREQAVDFAVSYWENPPAAGYTLVSQAEIYFEGKIRTYYLFEADRLIERNRQAAGQ